MKRISPGIALTALCLLIVQASVEHTQRLAVTKEMMHFRMEIGAVDLACYSQRNFGATTFYAASANVVLHVLNDTYYCENLDDGKQP
jgi:hypothetical protein